MGFADASRLSKSRDRQQTTHGLVTLKFVLVEFELVEFVFVEFVSVEFVMGAAEGVMLGAAEVAMVILVLLVLLADLPGR